DVAAAAFDVVSRFPADQLRGRSPNAIADVFQSLAAIAIVGGQTDQLISAARAIEMEIAQSTPNPRWLELAATACKIRLQTDGYVAALPMSEAYVARARASGIAFDLASTLLSQAIILTAAGQLAAAERL